MAPLLPREKLKPAEVKDVDGELKLVVQLMPQEIIKWKDIKLVKPISMGSFGEVFLARLKNLDVSVKRSLLRPDGSMTPEQLRNLEREINSYRKLNQTQAPCIVKYIGCILEHPNLAVVTEFLPNGNLFDLLFIQRVNLKAALRLKISSQVTNAVGFMHSCDPIMIHRDLKTQNLVLDAHFNIKVCDFGKTQELRSNCAIITGQDTGGSPRYMAPECFMLGAHITEKVDIWSLGCCLVEVLGGPLPYEEIPAMSEVQSLLQRGVPPLVPQWFTPNAQPMLRKCFEFNPVQRIHVHEIQLVLKGLTPQDLERHGMDKRRTR